MLYQYKGKDYNSKDEMLEDYKNDIRMIEEWSRKKMMKVKLED
jgi:hypothetical protein